MKAKGKHKHPSTSQNKVYVRLTMLFQAAHLVAFYCYLIYDMLSSGSFVSFILYIKVNGLLTFRVYNDIALVCSMLS